MKGCFNVKKNVKPNKDCISQNDFVTFLVDARGRFIDELQSISYKL